MMGVIGGKRLEKLLLIFLVFLVAAASFEGFFAKWAFRDDSRKYSLVRTLEGTAHRPVVYRRLLPDVATALENSMPTTLRTWVAHNLNLANPLAKTYKRASAATPEYIIRYYLIYGMSFFCFFTGILMLRRVCIEVTGDAVAGTLAPLAFAMLFPLFETQGGYFYDAPELLFMAMALWFAWRGWWWALLLLTPVAEFNKESFLFFIPTLYPFFRRTQSPGTVVGILSGAVLLAGMVYLGVRSLYEGNPGGDFESYLVRQVLFLINPLNYFQLEMNYIVITGKGFFFLHLLFLANIVKTSWPRLDAAWKQHIRIALAVNLPLFLVFCYPGELRNLSLLYASLVLLSTVYLSEVIRRNLQQYAPAGIGRDFSGRQQKRIGGQIPGGNVAVGTCRYDHNRRSEYKSGSAKP